MEHMKKKWVAVMEKERWQVITDEPEPLYIFEVAYYLPGDLFGKLTAQAICDMHNASVMASQGV